MCSDPSDDLFERPPRMYSILLRVNAQDVEQIAAARAALEKLRVNISPMVTTSDRAYIQRSQRLNQLAAHLRAMNEPLSTEEIFRYLRRKGYRSSRRGVLRDLSTLYILGRVDRYNDRTNENRNIWVVRRD